MAIAHEGTFKTEVHSDKLTLLPLVVLAVIAAYLLWIGKLSPL